MDERARIIRHLSPVIDGILWAFNSAASGVAADFHAGKGYDEGWCGYSRHVLLKNRLDRVFALGDYRVAPGDDPSSNLDVVFEELSQHDIDTFPMIQPGAVVTSDLNGSPGWAFNGVRFLLTSFPGQNVDEIDWHGKSMTKQVVASQSNPDRDLETLFHGVDANTDPSAIDIVRIHELGRELDLPTYVLAHGHDLVGGGPPQLWLGRSQLVPSEPWAWVENILRNPPRPPRGSELPTTSPDPSQAPDATVRLRPRTGMGLSARAAGSADKS